MVVLNLTLPMNTFQDPDPDVLEAHDSEWDAPSKCSEDRESEELYRDVLTGSIFFLDDVYLIVNKVKFFLE